MRGIVNIALDPALIMEDDPATQHWLARLLAGLGETQANIAIVNGIARPRRASPPIRRRSR